MPRPHSFPLFTNCLEGVFPDTWLLVYDLLEYSTPRVGASSHKMHRASLGGIIPLCEATQLARGRENIKEVRRRWPPSSCLVA